MPYIASSFADLPPFDLDDLMEVVGEPSLLAEIAALGVVDLIRLLDAIDRAPSTVAIVPLAHELKGVLLNLTAAAAAGQASTVEHVARSGDEAAARAALSSARVTIHEVMATLASAVAVAQAAS